MLILFVYSCSFSCVLLLSFKLLHSGNQKTHATKDLWLYIWGVKDRLSFLASLRPGLFCLTAPSRKLAGVCAKTSICKSVLYYLYVLDRHFEWLSLSFVLSNIPSPRTDLASHHGSWGDTGPENTWKRLNKFEPKKSPGKSGNVFSVSCSSVGNVILSSSPIPLYRQLPTEESHHRIVTVPFSSLCWCGHTILVTEMIQNCSFCSRRVETIPEKGWNESQRLLFDSCGGAWNSTSSIWHGSNMKRPNINNCYRVIIFQSLNGPF